MADAYARGLPRAKREIIHGAGHHVSMESPDAFNRVVRNFISAC
jgi:pimeloyl-ACP methyl ester carboxylesterase